MAYDLSLSAPLPFTLTEGSGSYSAVCAAANGVILIADDTTIWRSTDGENWSIAQTYAVGQWGSSKTLFWLGSVPYLLVRDGDVGDLLWSSTDLGITWSSTPAPSYQFSEKSAANGYLYTRGAGDSVSRTTDLSTFEVVSGLSVSSSIVHVSYGNGVWLASVDGGLYRSTDGVAFSLVMSDVFYGREPTLWHAGLNRFFAVSGSFSSPYASPLISSADGLTWAVHDTAVLSTHSPWQPHPGDEYFPPNDWWALADLVPVEGGILARMSSNDSEPGLYLYNYVDADGLYILSRSGGAIQITGANAVQFGDRVLVVGNCTVEDPSQSLSEYRAPTGVWLYLSPPAPAPEPIFWTNFTLSYEVP